MRFEVKNRDGAARIGQIHILDEKTTTPNVVFINTSRFQAPDFADFVIQNEDLKSEKILFKVGNSIFSNEINKKNDELFVDNYLLYPMDISTDLHKISIKYLKNKKNWCIIPPSLELLNDFLKYNNSIVFSISNAYQLLQNPYKFVNFILALRDKIGYQKIIYTPSIATPNNFSLLSYLGIDLFDSSLAINFARNDVLFFANGYLNKNEMIESQCSCPSCIKFSDQPSNMDFKHILNHNYYAMFNEIKLVRNCIYNGKLRELIETRISNSPELTSVLKILDNENYSFFEERLPITKNTILKSTTNLSLKRPEIKRFQDRIHNRYIKPNSAKILLLLPCSSKKPYSFSKTHKIFKEKLSTLKNPYIIHEMIITSPIGIVPRELELIYPASRYDIAVSGHWDEDEKHMIKTLLYNYLKIFNYKKIILHVQLDIQDFILDLLKNPIITCIDTPTSEKSLDRLYSNLEELTNQFEHIDYNQRLHENLLSIESYQFGKEIAKKLLENCIIKGRYPYHKIIKNNKQIGMITKDRGLVSLTIEGGKILSSFKKYWVEISDDFNLIGSVFAPGVKDADEDIRIGDEVVVLRNKEVCGVGVAQMNGKEMIESNHGESVKVRHRC